MARTAQTNIKLRNNGTPLGSGFNTLDLVSGISATDAGSGVASLTGSASAGSNVATESLTPTTSGANITLNLASLTHTFVLIEVVFRNGQALTPVTDWSRSVNTITVTNSTTTDVFLVQYTW